jgi:hypothetical protein
VSSHYIYSREIFFVYYGYAIIHTKKGVRMSKARLTISIDEDARKLIDHYAGKRGIGHFFGELVKKYAVEEHYGAEMIRRRLDRIETHLLHLLDGR